MAEIYWDNVSKRFGSVTAVDHLTLTAHDQEFLVLLGPSGCGKTTTLRMAAGLEDATEGRISVGGRDATHLEPKDRDLAMVFQNYALYPHMTVFENLAFGLRLRKTPAADIQRLVHSAAAQLGLEPLLQRRPSALSGGQRQRVALGRALVRQPKAFLMDEPLSNLDATLRAQTRLQLKVLHRQLAATIVYVTHDQTEAMTLASRIVVMRDGVVQQVDTPEGIYDRPANQFVASFLGTPGMNLVPAQLTRTSGTLSAAIGTQRLELTADSAWQLERAAGRSVVLGIRPEHIHVGGPEGQGTNPMSLRARVRLVEPMGHETMVHVDLDHDVQLTARSIHHWSASPGSLVSLSLDTRHLHAFDPETEVACEAR